MSLNEIANNPMPIAKLVEYQANSIVSKVLLKKKSGNVTLFAFWEGQELSEHISPFDAMVICLDGTGMVKIDGKENVLNIGDVIGLPANRPHSVKALENFKMLLIMVKE